MLIMKSFHFLSQPDKKKIATFSLFFKTLNLPTYLDNVVMVEASDNLDFPEGVLDALGVSQDNFLHGYTLVTVSVNC